MSTKLVRDKASQKTTAPEEQHRKLSFGFHMHSTYLCVPIHTHAHTYTHVRARAHTHRERQTMLNHAGHSIVSLRMLRTWMDLGIHSTNPLCV